MKVEEFSVKYPIFVNLLSLFILLAGSFAILRMNREAFPNFSFDIVTVRTELPGASPQEVEKLVSQAIEEKIEEVDGLEKYESVSTEGLSLIIITLDPDEKDKEQVINEIQRAVDRTENLPSEIEDKPLVKEIQTKTTPIVEVSLQSNDIPYPEMRRHTKNLADRLETLKEVSSVVKMGYKDREMSVEVNPTLLKQKHIALNDIILALRKQNRNVPGGKFVRGNEEFLIRTVGEFYTAEEIGDTIIRANDLGGLIRVRDVATVRNEFEEEDITYRTHGKKAIKIVILKKEEADAITLVEEVGRVVEEFKKEIPGAIELELINDISYYIKRRLNILRNNAVIALILVIGCLLIFLSRGIALMTALGLPVAVFTALFVMYQFDITINLISMFGLIMVLGILVDDSIIVAENIYHHLEQGEEPRSAAIKATKEVFLPVSATIVTTIAAFLPLMFMSGIMGKFVRTIPLVVIIALAASWFEAVFILPSHVAEAVQFHRWWKRKRTKHKKDFLKPLRDLYGLAINRSLKYRYTVLVVCIFALLGTAWFYKTKMDFVLFSKEGIEIFFIRGEAPVGTPLERTDELFIPINNIVNKFPPKFLDTFTSQIGIIQNDPGDPFTIRGSHVGQVVVFLTPAPSREKTAAQIIDEVRPQLKNIPGFERVWIDRVNPGPPVGKPIAIRLQGEDFKVLDEISEIVKEKLKSINGVVDIRDDYERGKEEYVFKTKPGAAAFTGLSVEDIALTLQTAYDGSIATIIKNPEEDIDVVVRFPPEERANPNSLNKLYVRNQWDNLVPLKSVTTFQKQPGITVIKHLDRKRVVSVTASVKDEVTTSAKVNQIMKDIMTPIMKNYLDNQILYSGEQEDTDKSLNDLKVSFILAAVLILLILATNFRSLIQPPVILTAIPLSFIGVVFSFYFQGIPMGFMALLGLVGLSGVVVNDAIVLLDAINKNREKGMPLFEAIIDGSKRRLRPVLLTTLTTVLGLGPVAYGLGGSDPFLIPMAMAMAWGLLFASLLTLIIIPCFYHIAYDIRDGSKKLFEKATGRSLSDYNDHREK